MINSPCLHCEERHTLCWDECSKYKDFKVRKEEQNKAMRKTELDMFLVEQKIKSRKKKDQ